MRKQERKWINPDLLENINETDKDLHRQSEKLKRRRYCLPIKIIEEEASEWILQTLKAERNTVKSIVWIN